MTAKDRFHYGQRVRISPVGERNGIRESSTRHGRVVGFGRTDDLVRVLPDGCVTVQTYHHSFWEAEA